MFGYFKPKSKEKSSEVDEELEEEENKDQRQASFAEKLHQTFKAKRVRTFFILLFFMRFHMSAYSLNCFLFGYIKSSSKRELSSEEEHHLDDTKDRRQTSNAEERRQASKAKRVNIVWKHRYILCEQHIMLL